MINEIIDFKLKKMEETMRYSTISLMFLSLMILACGKDCDCPDPTQPGLSTTLPLSNMNWVCAYIHPDGIAYVDPAPGVFEVVAEGLKIYGTGYRGGALIHPVPF